MNVDIENIGERSMARYFGFAAAAFATLNVVNLLWFSTLAV
ncbi:MAG TPA: hypothetical protein VF440_10165 [Novosphingobium sp.]